MDIRYLENERIFKIDTEHVSYVMAVMDDEKFLEHVYFGKRVGDSAICSGIRKILSCLPPTTVRGARSLPA